MTSKIKTTSEMKITLVFGYMMVALHMDNCMWLYQGLVLQTILCLQSKDQREQLET